MQHSHRSLFAIIALAFLLPNAGLFGQVRVDDRVPAEMKAIAAINIDVATLYKNPLVKQLVDMSLENAGEVPVKPTDISKIAAFVAAPKGTDLPSLSQTNFYVYVGFTNTTSSDALRKLMLSEQGREVTIGGKKLIAPPEGEDVGIYFDMQPKYMVAGTEAYLTSPSNQFATKRLAALYQGLPKAPIRMAVDLDGARDLLDEVSAMAKANADFMTRPYVSFIDEIAALTVTSDMESGSLLNLSMIGHDEAEGKKIKQKMDALLGLAKQMGESIPAGGPETLLIGAMDDLEAKQDGAKVSLDIKKPEGFEEMVTNAAKSARGAAKQAQDMNNFKQVLLAMHNYHAVYREFPWQKHCDGEDSGKGLGWAVFVLPFLEQNNLFDQFDKEAEYDSPKNAKLAQIVIPTYQLNTGGQIKWVRPSVIPTKMSKITDGTSNTVAFVQSRKVDMSPWTKAISIKPADVLAEFKALKPGETMLFGMYDGSVRRMTKENDVAEIEAMLEPADGKYPQR